LSITKNQRNEKVQAILKGAVKVLANKGYEGATIVDIAEASNVSRGVLHYYFKDKEDIATKALASSSTQMIQSSLQGLKGETPEEIANNVIDMHKKNIRETPDFYRFLFEISCLSRRSKKVYDEFIICQDKVIHAIKDWLQNACNENIIKIRAENRESIAEILLYMSDGIAFHLIDRPNKTNDTHMWNNFKEIIIDLLDK
jgi:TetR/AcrR family transcriptional regulator, fatty acid metabolism regulator protein